MPWAGGGQGGKTIGGFSVLVSICQADLVLKGRFATDPFVKISVGAQNNRTKTKANQNKPIWNESYVFSGFSEKPQNVQFEIFDSDLFRNESIGSALLPMSSVSFRDNADDLSEFKWIDLVDKANAALGRLQVRITGFNPNSVRASDVEVFDYSHILQVTVKSGSGLRGGETFVETTLGDSSFATKSMDSKDPVFDQSGCFLVNSKSQEKFLVQFGAHDQDSTTGFAYVPLGTLIQSENATVEKELKLEDHAVKTDRDLSPKASSHGQTQGVLLVSFRLVSKDTVLKDFWKKLVDRFDISDEKVNGLSGLDRHEVNGMLGHLNVHLSPERFESLWEIADSNKLGIITQEEGESLLRALLLHRDTAAALTVFLVAGDEVFDGHLMNGVTHHVVHPGSVVETITGKADLQIMDRETGLLVSENIPSYIKVAMTSMFHSQSARMLSTSHKSIKIMHKMSVKQGEKFGSPASKSEIPGFIQLHNLNVAEMEKPVDQYNTFNEFFSRSLKPEARPVAEPDKEGVAVSPADCRLSVFTDINEATRLWIKGDEFTVENLLGPQLAPRLAERFKSGSMAIARLAPQDYHRWHFPVSGRTGKRTEIDGALFTVNPIAINQNVNVYTTNKRQITELESKEFGLVLVIAVGATMVGSIKYVEPREGVDVQKGAQHGYFEFGGSTVILLFEPKRIVFDRDLVRHSQRQLEMLVKVNTRLGQKFA